MPSPSTSLPHPALRLSPLLGVAAFILLLFTGGGCATIRITDPPRTATEQFLITQAAQRAIDQLSAVSLRDREVFVETTTLTATNQPTQWDLFIIAELRARLLMQGVRLVEKREKAKIILELRAPGASIDRLELLVGVPSTSLGSNNPATSGVPVTTPDLIIFKSAKQMGFASVAFVAYWADTGEVVASSGPFVGRTVREDFWILGYHTRAAGNIAPTETGQ